MKAVFGPSIGGSQCRHGTEGRGADVVFDTVGGPLFEPALKALAHRGRQLVIASVGDRRISFDLIDALLEALVPLFDQGTFQPPRIDRVLALSDGPAAYQEVASGQVRGRLVLAP
jgi:NADPH:quinone reductase